jgi:trk system potassium uptake protein TrkH
MILKPTRQDFQAIGYYLGKIILGITFTMILPILIGLFTGEINPTLDFSISLLIGLIFGFLLTKLCYTDRELNWMQGMIVVSLSWLAAMFLGAIPMYLSGNWNSYLDACFDSMSGFATTGLALVQDLDHLSLAHNFWRHFIMFLGGQGIGIVALAFFMKSTSGGFKIYIGEARDEKILPNVIQTARFIWIISIVYLIIGTVSLAVTGLCVGMKPASALFHGACIFMAGFDTGGFSPQSQSILYYHSLPFEIVTIVIVILGTLNFNLHYQIWSGRWRELIKNVESRTFFLSVAVTFLIVAFGLNQLGVYPKLMVMFRKGFFQLISGHSTAGYMTIYAQQFVQDWGNLALFVLICSMALGGSACSTAGGIKMLRAGIIFKAFKEDIKRIVLPEKAIVVQKFHHIRSIFLTDTLARSALMVTFAYIILYVLGALVGMALGYPALQSMFESVSAAANVGFSCGITDTAMPSTLKITYIIQMWAGRLEFMSVFTLIGFLVAVVKGK